MIGNINIKQVIVSRAENKVSQIILDDGTVLSSGNTEYKTQNKVVTPSLKRQVITPDVNYEGLAKVTVAATPLEELTISLADLKAGEEFTVNSSNIGFSKVTITE